MTVFSTHIDMQKQKKEKNSLLDSLRIIKNTIFAVILGVMVIVLLYTAVVRVSGNPPFIFGYSVFRVSSASMRPTLETGDVILVRDWDPMELAKGDIISYRGVSGEFEGKIVTHRVIKEPFQKEDGKWYVLTQGDDNPNSDSPVELDLVLGKVDRKLGFMTALYNFFITPWGLIAALALIILAFFNEIVIFVRTIFNLDAIEADNEKLEEFIDKYRTDPPPKKLSEKQTVPAEQFDAISFSEAYDDLEQKDELDEIGGLEDTYIPEEKYEPEETDVPADEDIPDDMDIPDEIEEPSKKNKPEEKKPQKQLRHAKSSSKRKSKKK